MNFLQMLKQSKGPDDLFIHKYISSNLYTKNIPKNIVNNILNKHIPIHKDYGTWEGFEIFGPDYEIYYNVKKDLNKYKKAVLILKVKFIPIWLENAYKINGCMYNKIKFQTLVGKPVG
jgi:hypothetical protein